MNFFRERRFFRSLFSFASLQATQTLLPLLAFPYLGRILGVEHFGLLMFMSILAPLIALFLDWGAAAGGSRALARARGKHAELARITGAVFSAKFMLLAVCLPALVCLQPFIPFAEANPLGYYMAIFAGCCRGFSPLWHFQGMGKGLPFMAALDVGATFFALLLIFIFIRKPEHWVFYFLFLGSCRGSVYLFLNWRIWRKFRFRFSLQAGWLAIGKTFAIFCAAAMPMFSSYGFNFLLGFYLDAAGIGALVACNKMMRALAGVALPIAQSIYPEVCIAHVKHKQSDSPLLPRALAFTLALVGGASFVAWIFAPQLLKLALGGAYEYSETTLRLTLVAAPLLSCNALLGAHGLVAHNLEKIQLLIQALAAAITLPATVICGKFFGLTGCAILPALNETLLCAGFITAILRYCPQAFFGAKVTPE